MRVVSTDIEQAGDGLLKITTIVALEREAGAGEGPPPLGQGPTRDTVPDRIVRFLIACGPEGAQMNQVQRAVGGNPRTANRQIWTLGANSPDLPARLRGWVASKGNGRYALTPAAWAQLRRPEWSLAEAELRNALKRLLDELPGVIDKARAWQVASDDGAEASASRDASDRALFDLLEDAAQANTMYGEATGWDTSDTGAALVLQLQKQGQAFRKAIHQPVAFRRLEALDELAEVSRAALALLDEQLPR